MADLSFSDAMGAHGAAPAPKPTGLTLDQAMEQHILSPFQGENGCHGQ